MQDFPNIKSFNREGIYFIISLSLLLVAIAHATLGDHGRNLSISLGTVLIITGILSYVYLISFFERNSFFILISIYIASHFPIFLTGGGGLFNIVSFGLFLVLLVIPPIDVYGRDVLSAFLVTVLLVLNFVGYLIGDLEFEHKANGFITIVGIFFIYKLSQTIVLTEYRILIIIKIAAILGILNLFVTINTHFELINIKSPLFISQYELDTAYQLIANTGTFNTIELFGEWGLLNSFLLLPFVFIKQKESYLNSSDKLLITTGWFSSFLCGFLSFSKSVFILSIIGIIFYIFFFIIILKQGSILPKIMGLIIPIFFIAPFIIHTLQLDHILIRINENPDFLRNFINNPITGEGTSREAVYQLGLERISERNWILGNGWSIPEGNKISWFGSSSDHAYADYHNFYLCLIPIFGIPGSIILIFLYIRTLFSCFNQSIRLRSSSYLFLPFIIGLTFVLFFFLINEFKINATRNSYFTIYLIWLGIATNANNYVKTNLFSS